MSPSAQLNLFPPHSHDGTHSRADPLAIACPACQRRCGHPGLFPALGLNASGIRVIPGKPMRRRRRRTRASCGGMPGRIFGSAGNVLESQQQPRLMFSTVAVACRICRTSERAGVHDYSAWACSQMNLLGRSATGGCSGAWLGLAAGSVRTAASVRCSSGGSGCARRYRGVHICRRRGFGTWCGVACGGGCRRRLFSRVRGRVGGRIRGHGTRLNCRGARFRVRGRSALAVPGS